MLRLVFMDTPFLSLSSPNRRVTADPKWHIKQGLQALNGQPLSGYG